MNEIERIQALSNVFGPSGFEDDVAKLVKEEIKEFNPEEDCMRNVRAVVNPEKKEGVKVMLDAHLDEVGLIVQAVKPNGTMKFLPIGGWVPTNFPSSRFNIKNKDGELVHSVVTAKPPHFASEAEKKAAPTVDNMVLDCGSTSKEEAEENYKIGIASPGAPDVTCSYDEKNRLFFGKAFDCRIGVAAEIETMKELAGKDLPCIVQAAFSSQEEVGERGVYANYKAFDPDIMICFEGCPADDTFQEPWLVQAALYKGPMLRHFDVSMITSPRFQKFSLDIAHKYNIPVQESVRSGGGTDAGMIHKQGIPCIVIGVPVRYIHSSNCYCTLDDYQNSVKLAVKIIENLTEDVLKSF